MKTSPGGLCASRSSLPCFTETEGEGLWPPWGWRARPGQACWAQAVLARGKQVSSQPLCSRKDAQGPLTLDNKRGCHTGNAG